MDSNELKNIFEYELKIKLAQKCRTKNDEIRFLLNSFKFYDYQSSLIIDKNKWIKGILKTGLCGFNINDLSDIFNKYDLYSTGYINYNNFCNYIYGKEKFMPITKSYLNDNREAINDIYTSRLKSPFNDFKPPGLYERNYQLFNLPEISKNNDFNDNQRQIKQSPNTPFISKPFNLNNNQKNLPNLSIEKYSLSYENDSYFKKLLLLLQSKINKDNGVTYYTFAQKIKLHENKNDNTITLNSFYSTLRDINISFRLNDLTDLFNYLEKTNSNNNSVLTENILKLIRGNLNQKRKNLIEYSFSLIDKDKLGRVAIDIIKNVYNCKLHPDVYIGLKQEEEILKEFYYTFDIYCSIYNVKEYINSNQFLEYYSGISPSIVDDNYFEDILNGVWNNNIKRSKNINSLINDNLIVNSNYNEKYRKELMENKINNKINFYLNNRYVNSPNKNIYNYIENKDNENIIKNKKETNFLSPYKEIPKENERHENYEKITPYYHPLKTPLYKGVKMFRSLRHNPITNEYIMNKEKPIDDYYESSQVKNQNRIINYDNKINLQTEKPLKELEQLREIIISRGQKGIFNFQKILSLYDKEKKYEINYNKFNEILEIFNINMSKQSTNNIFYYFDKEKKGFINYNNLINELVGNISIKREIIIKNLFDSFIKDKNNNILISDLKKRFKAKNHPDIKYKAEREIYYDFIESIDIFNNYKNKNNYNNNFFNYQEFLDYYKELNISFKEDKDFEILLNNCWNDKEKNIYYNNEENNKLYSSKDNNLRIQTANQILTNNGYY